MLVSDSSGAWLHTKTRREIGVRRFSGRRHNPHGGLHDSAAEGWIIRAITLWVPAIIRLVHIFNIQWGILGRRLREEAKGQLSRATRHVLIKMCKHTRVCCQQADFSIACVCLCLCARADRDRFWLGCSFHSYQPCQGHWLWNKLLLTYPLPLALPETFLLQGSLFLFFFSLLKLLCILTSLFRCLS